jgi:Short C-terminal domain
VLFLLRPRQTWMPYALPRSRPQQELYNQELHKAYMSTRQLEPATPSPQRDVLADLKDLARLRDTGVLSDAEFAAAKAKILDADDPTT